MHTEEEKKFWRTLRQVVREDAALLPIVFVCFLFAFCGLIAGTCSSLSERAMREQTFRDCMKQAENIAECSTLLP